MSRLDKMQMNVDKPLFARVFSERTQTAEKLLYDLKCPVMAVVNIMQQFSVCYFSLYFCLVCY